MNPIEENLKLTQKSSFERLDESLQAHRSFIKNKKDLLLELNNTDIEKEALERERKKIEIKERRKLYFRERYRNSEVNKKKKEAARFYYYTKVKNNPEALAKKREYHKKYIKRSEVKERKNNLNKLYYHRKIKNDPEILKKNRERARFYYQRSKSASLVKKEKNTYKEEPKKPIEIYQRKHFYEDEKLNLLQSKDYLNDIVLEKIDKEKNLISLDMKEILSKDNEASAEAKNWKKEFLRRYYLESKKLR